MSRGSSYKYDRTLRRSHHAPQREQPTESVRSKIIIATEGPTEAVYFREIVSVERDRVRKVYIPASNIGSNPLSVVRAAIATKDEHVRKKSWMEGDEAYAVFDGDEHIEGGDRGRLDRYYQALDLANGNNIKIVITNPSIEFWYLLHFEYTASPVHRDDALRRVESLIPGYVKGDKFYGTYRNHLQPLLDTAIANARKLRAYSKETGCGNYDNPCTSVDDILCSLLGL